MGCGTPPPILLLPNALLCLLGCCGVLEEKVVAGAGEGGVIAGGDGCRDGTGTYWHWVGAAGAREGTTATAISNTPTAAVDSTSTTSSLKFLKLISAECAFGFFLTQVLEKLPSSTTNGTCGGDTGLGDWLRGSAASLWIG